MEIVGESITRGSTEDRLIMIWFAIVPFDNTIRRLSKVRSTV